jgi:membrane-associated protease RseP (regulator of RpoE activity)
VHFALTLVLVFLGTLAIGVVDDKAPVVAAPVASIPVSVDKNAATVPAPVQAVLQQGDRVLAVDGRSVSTWEQVVRAVRAAPERAIELTVRRDGQTKQIAVTPVPVQRPSLTDPDVTERVGAIGVGPRIVTKHVGPVAAVKQTGTTVKEIVTGTWDTLRYRLGSITKLYSPDRDRQGIVGVVGAGRVSGELLGATEFSFAFRLLNLVVLLAGLNFFIGVFNLLPLLPLDGGHIAVVWFEAARDKLRRLRGYTGELQRVDYTKLMPVTYAVALAFAGLTLFILGADIVNPITLDG